MNQKRDGLSLLARAPTREREAATVPAPRIQWRTRIALPGLILLSATALVAYSARGALWPATPVRVVPVVVKSDASGQAEGTVVVQAPGWVEADPFSVAVSALADGVVSEVLVLEGERIEKGQVVARLVDEDARISLNQADAMLSQRKAELVAAQAILDEAQRNWDHPIELVRKQETSAANLAEKQAELARWPHELAREEARAVYLKEEAERVATLRDGGNAASIELVETAQAYQAHLAFVETTRSREPILQAQIRSLEAESQAAAENLRLRIADTRVLAEAKAALMQAESAVASAEAMRAEAALRLERMEVRSPADGVVMVRLVEPGSKLMLQMDNPRSSQVVRIYDPQKLQVRVDIPLVDAAKVGVGQLAEVIVDVLPNTVYSGRVSRIVHEADVQKNTLQVKVAIDHPTSEIKPEMLARARFLAVAQQDDSDDEAPAAQSIFVPRSAVIERNGQAFVWLADQVEQRARLQSLELGRATIEDWIVANRGVNPGDRIIVDAPNDLQDGQRIRIQED